jgi:hypothetical protein
MLQYEHTLQLVGGLVASSLGAPPSARASAAGLSTSCQVASVEGGAVTVGTNAPGLVGPVASVAGVATTERTTVADLRGKLAKALK